MTDKKIINIYLLFGTFILVFHWFFWDIVDIITPFLIFIPLIIVLISVVGFLIHSFWIASKNVKRLKSKAFIPLLIIIVTILVNIFFPFTDASLQLNFLLNVNARNEVVNLIQTEELKPEKFNNLLIMLPLKYRRLSKGGGEVFIEHFEDHDAYVFFTFRGVLDNFSGFVYDPDEYAIAELETRYVQVLELRDSWYYCASN